RANAELARRATASQRHRARPAGRVAGKPEAWMTTVATLPIQELSDEALMQSLALGRQDALELLYRRHGPPVCNLIAQALDRPAAEEIVQDVFLTVWHKADSFDPRRGSFRGWVLRMAQFRIRNEVRPRRRRPPGEPDPEGPPPA